MLCIQCTPRDMGEPRFLDAPGRMVLAGIAAIADGNPFLPGRAESERMALGPAFRPVDLTWHADAARDGDNPNVPLLGALVERLVPALRSRLASGARADARELAQYEQLVHYHLFSRAADHFYELVETGSRGTAATKRIYERFVAEASRHLTIPGVRLPAFEPAHLFAVGFQIRRAFHHTFRQIYGGSAPASRLRAAVWESIFTHDRRRYMRSLYTRMGDVTTLVVGESGTGKELVARAIALSRYVEFDPRTHTFADDWASACVAVNLSALVPTLIESELFGHRRGAFTGALEDRIGYLESCSAAGSVFLDEVGELGGEVQVKLLRVLQTRTFQRAGETRERVFRGKIVAASNRDLATEIRDGRFRPDLYYRLCGDVITTPTLREQLDAAPDDLRNLILVLAPRIAGPDEHEALADQVHAWVTRHLGNGYAWPGNMRELEQCVRNVMIRGSYRPPAVLAEPADGDPLLDPIRAGTLTADELLRRYCTHVHALTGSYQETARRLGIDRRTVRAKVDPGLRTTGGAVRRTR
jgi:transcriptional regulator with AAA-type ATPase domain